LTNLHGIWHGDAHSVQTGLAVKISDFEKSTMADGRHLENSENGQSQQRFNQSA